jgi:hypothetical protein
MYILGGAPSANAANPARLKIMANTYFMTRTPV